MGTKRIAIVKKRTGHDLEWHMPPALVRAVDALALEGVLGRVRRTQGQAFMPQLTLPYLAALGRAYDSAAGTRHEFEVRDAREEELRLEGCDMAWFTVSTPNAPATYRVSDMLRARGVPTVLGGIHPSVMPGEAAGHATAIATGDGEETVPRILADFDEGRLRARYDGGRAASMDGLPVPLWGREADASGGGNDPCPWVVPVQTSRGCRNACAFCSTTRFQGAARRHRPAGEVADEIRALQDAGVLTPDKTVFFTDNNIVSDSDHRRGARDTRHARELFEALLPLGIAWVGQGEVSVADDPDLVDLMARSGCHLLLVGLETVSQSAMDGIGKPGNRVGRYAAALETLHDHGIANIGCFIAGLDGDGPGVFDATAAFIRRHVDVPQLSLLTPFPGTPLFRRAEADGRLLHRDWSRYDILHVVSRPALMTPGELRAGYDRLVDEVYSPWAMASRALRYAARRTVNGMPRFGFAGRLSSVLAPNLVYRRLARLGRRDVAADGAGARTAAGEHAA
ncbi:MAG: B12-binding domain-containing radical SAM protein [Deltaproteobacteria bacterium]|nr:B12-binding domain-containing radical SAM protein [Deltaproteobacteria bacterium]